MAKAAYRRSDVARLIMSRVHVRPRTERCAGFNLTCVHAVLEAFGHKSVWSEGTDDLTIVRINRSKPLGVGNAMVLQVREANRQVPASILAKARGIAGKMNANRSPSTSPNRQGRRFVTITVGQDGQVPQQLKAHSERALG
jgi:hypothetical protein